MNPQRRQILIRSASAAAVAALDLPAFSANADDAPRAADGIDVHIELHAVVDQVTIRPGAPTRVWRYQAKLLRGATGALNTQTGAYLGPLIRVRRGQRVRIDLINELPESTIIHWHGLHVPQPMDGHPQYAIAPDQRYVYDFTVVNRAGSYWFHPHPHGRTGKQVYFGLAGLFQVSDDEEAALDLPTGAYDLPLVIQDRSFDDTNQFVYLSQRLANERVEDSTGGAMMGMLGNQVLVNGRPDASIEVARRPYRLRLLNGSNSRIYKLAWNDASPLTVIATDGGLLAAPLQRDYVMLAPAERIDLWVDFGRWSAGAELRLQSLSFESGMAMGGMMGGMMGSAALPDGAAFPVLALRMAGGAASRAAPPHRLSTMQRPDPRIAINFDQPKVFDLTMGMMRWGLNGQSFDMLGASSLETVRLGTHEVWEFRNDGAMAMPHSMHVHGLQFRVITRSAGAGNSRSHGTVNAGFVDEGWKDTVLVMPGERVRLLLGFADYPGLFLYHCHMLEHEDGGLMRNYLARA